ncbi:MAG TPA: hypothetical protein VH350_10155 [Candidatus Sulfotelmatobacter sp.]|nr:hypothetical protein [Candidatus Sulfotelmatobacter sp.]
MKTWGLLCLLAIALSANAQDKPRVFVQGKGSENVSSNGSGVGGRHWGTWGSKSTVDAHDESMEVTKDLQKNCSGAVVTINESNADYIVMMNRESKQNRGLLRSNSQIQFANKAGDVIGTNATHTVGNAAKDACNLIVADWSAHGPVNVQQGAEAPAPASIQPAVQVSSPSVQVVPAVATAGQAKVVNSSDSVAAAAQKEKQHQACLALAKDNPSITCQ